MFEALCTNVVQGNLSKTDIIRTTQHVCHREVSVYQGLLVFSGIGMAMFTQAAKLCYQNSISLAVQPVHRCERLMKGYFSNSCKLLCAI